MSFYIRENFVYSLSTLIGIQCEYLYDFKIIFSQIYFTIKKKERNVIRTIRNYNK